MSSKKESFTKQFEELEKITAAFEAGKYDLDEGLQQFERGLAIAAELKKTLATVEQKIEAIKKKFDAPAAAAEKSNKNTGDALPF